MTKMQATIGEQVECEGIALHSGENAHLRLIPAPVDTGVVFTRVDVTDADNVVAAVFDNVGETMLGTTIMNAAGTTVATIEHLMAALAALQIDNVHVELFLVLRLERVITQRVERSRDPTALALFKRSVWYEISCELFMDKEIEGAI